MMTKKVLVLDIEVYLYNMYFQMTIEIFNARILVRLYGLWQEFFGVFLHKHKCLCLLQTKRFVKKGIQLQTDN